MENLNDTKILKEQIVTQIYTFPEKKVSLAYNIEFTENFLVYIDRIKNVSISKNSHDYNKYFNLSKVDMKSSLFNTYDSLLKNKYKIEINYKTLDSIKNNIR